MRAVFLKIERKFKNFSFINDFSNIYRKNCSHCSQNHNRSSDAKQKRGASRCASSTKTARVCSQKKAERRRCVKMANYKHRMAEAAIKDFPAIKKDYDSYKLMLDARALAGGGCVFDERVDGGGASDSVGDRYLDRYNDPVLRNLHALVEGIYLAFNGLTSTERRIVALRYWRNMEVPTIAHELRFSESNVYRVTNRALCCLYRPVLNVQQLLEDWRVGKLK